MAISTKTKAQWKERFRKESRYWSGTGEATGWCIFSRSDKYMLGETGVLVEKDWTTPRKAKRFGPFDSFDAARAAFEILGSMD